MFIYLIVNHVTGKYYVGQHKGPDLKKYLRYKFSDARTYQGSSYLFNSMKKYPLPCDWSIHALLSDIQTKAELDQKEKDFIAFLKSRDPEYGYNLCRGGEGFSGPHSTDSKEKNRQSSLQTWQDPIIRERRVKNQAKVRDERGGSFLTSDSIQKIKTARASQDETPRIEGCQKYAQEHPEEMKARLSHNIHVLGGKAGTREDKRKAGLLGAANGGVKARHTRWHVNRGQSNPQCSLCQLSASSLGARCL